MTRYDNVMLYGWCCGIKCYFKTRLLIIKDENLRFRLSVNS